MRVKFKYLNFIFSRLQFCLVLLVCLFVLQGNDALAQKKKSHKNTSSFDVELRFATIYDNNILKYSEKYLDRFINNQDEGRFHIDTYDDIILYQSLGIAYNFRIFKKLKSKVNFEFNNNYYVVNNIKNWYYANIGFQQYFTKRASFKVFYYYMPEYYVRHFRDEDWVAVYGYTPQTFMPFSYSKDNYGFWIQNTFFKDTRIRLMMDYSRYYYNKHYTEYDSKNFLYGINLYQPIIKNLRVEAGYHYATSDAKGYDQPGETKQNSDDSDASYEEDGYRFGVTYDLPRIKKIDHNLAAEFVYEKRYFTSQHYLEEDREHAGRVDKVFEMSFTYAVEFSKSWKLSAFYNYFMRESSTSAVENQAYLSAEKDYHQSQVGLEVTYNLKF